LNKDLARLGLGEALCLGFKTPHNTAVSLDLR
jgi:hypothetical protein